MNGFWFDVWDWVVRAVMVVEVFERTCWNIILLSADGKMCSIGSLIVLGIVIDIGKG